MENVKMHDRAIHVILPEKMWKKMWKLVVKKQHDYESYGLGGTGFVRAAIQAEINHQKTLKKGLKLAAAPGGLQ